jgi:hypothetical protein
MRYAGLDEGVAQLPESEHEQSPILPLPIAEVAGKCVVVHQFLSNFCSTRAIG